MISQSQDSWFSLDLPYDIDLTPVTPVTPVTQRSPGPRISRIILVLTCWGCCQVHCERSTKSSSRGRASRWVSRWVGEVSFAMCFWQEMENPCGLWYLDRWISPFLERWFVKGFRSFGCWRDFCCMFQRYVHLRDSCSARKWAFDFGRTFHMLGNESMASSWKTIGDVLWRLWPFERSQWFFWFPPNCSDKPGCQEELTFIFIIHCISICIMVSRHHAIFVTP